MKDVGPLALADSTVRTVQLIVALDQHLSVASDPARGLARRDFALQGQQVVQAAQLLLLGHVVDHSRRRECAGARRIHGDVDDVKLHLFNQRAGIEVSSFGLARKSYDDVGHEPDVGHQPPGSVDDRSVVACLVAPSHAPQHHIVTRLDRQLQLATNDVARGHDLEQLRLQILRMRREEAKPPQPGNLLDFANERGEATPAVGIVIVVHVLAEENDLLCSVRDGLTALGHHGFKGHVLLATPDPRDDAERAVVVASLDDAYEVADSRAPGMRERLTQRVVVAPLQVRDESVVVSDRHDRIEVWEAACQGLALFGHDAAGDRDGAVGRLPLFQLMQLRVNAVL